MVKFCIAKTRDFAHKDRKKETSLAVKRGVALQHVLALCQYPLRVTGLQCVLVYRSVATLPRKYLFSKKRERGDMTRVSDGSNVACLPAYLPFKEPIARCYILHK